MEIRSDSAASATTAPSTMAFMCRSLLTVGNPLRYNSAPAAWLPRVAPNPCEVTTRKLCAYLTLFCKTNRGLFASYCDVQDWHLHSNFSAEHSSGEYPAWKQQKMPPKSS